ncbi:MAG: hypothetical protein H8D78_18345 [Chloroflexi bacterium]|nr:hypothetical protein [Chloroflexota bacterium]
MDKRKRYLTLAVALAVVIIAGACICGQCSNPFSRPAQERIEENVPIVSGADLGEAVMARGIGEGNRPVGVTDTFSDSEDVIYCVVEARRIDAGTSFYARWVYDGEPFEDTPTITADRDYTSTYIEFHIEPKDFDVLKSGDYACKIYVNGNPVQTVEFTVR